jgi:hypothetical protein
VAVDTILTRLDEEFHKKKVKKTGSKVESCDGGGEKLNMIRLGHPARMNEKILKYSLDSLISNDDVFCFFFFILNIMIFFNICIV